MSFIKIKNIVINTNYIAAVKLENETHSGEKCVSILIATPTLSVLQYEWLDFTDKEAIVLQDYFSSFNNVTDLCLQHQL